MQRIDWMVKVTLVAITAFLGLIALRPLVDPETKVLAQSARYEHVGIISPLFLYKGEQGLLVIDKRNAKVWFFPKRNDNFENPVFVRQLPFEKLDQAPE